MSVCNHGLFAVQGRKHLIYETDQAVMAVVAVILARAVQMNLYFTPFTSDPGCPAQPDRGAARCYFVLFDRSGRPYFPMKLAILGVSSCAIEFDAVANS
ncbi:hypothetical protein A5779_21225 [Mycolicibacterium peregrinum]|uniref:Uncharacterized protein n=1 Tax=Mycolicibacterium peregrinum TaxID=43304 RepID=A0A1A0W8J2_MYCPR|nr:hypothetical protein A5779_21225 [Mycolicibacterium peregrinum]